MCKSSFLEKIITVRLIREDVETIYSLLQTERDSIFHLEVLPFYALFVQSCQEYIGENFISESIEKDFKDIRNHIKSYSESFGKSKKRVLYVDDFQNEDYKNRLRFNFLKAMNIHYNLGCYWTDAGNIVGNTQQIEDFYNTKSMFNDTMIREKNFQIGNQIGSFVASVREGISYSLDYPFIERPTKSAKIKYYCDINTNRKNNFFQGASKELNLFFLHLLCNMNFVKHVLRTLIIDGNTWLFRVEYIVSYYTLRALERFKNHYENNKGRCVKTEELIKIINEGETIFKTKLRNCMMHYSVEGLDVFTFKDMDKPFYGIIENCFDGMSYQEYLVALHTLSDKIINYLDNQFNFSFVKLKRL